MSKEQHEYEVRKWKVIDSEYVLENKWMKVRRDTCELTNGSVIDDYFVVERFDSAGIVALTEDNRIILNREYRHGIQEIIYQVPIGGIDPGEDPLQAAIRELEEEAGYLCAAEEMTEIGHWAVSPGDNIRYTTIFLARNVKPGGKKLITEREVIDNELFTIEEVTQMLDNNEIADLWAVAALRTALNHLQ